MIIHEEKVDSNFEGTIIDLETIGEFSQDYDSRKYQKIIPIIFGFIDNKTLKIFCAKNESSIAQLKEIIKTTLPNLKKPFYSFNSDFERGTLFHFLGKQVNFEGELNSTRFERKENVIINLKLPSHGDPFAGNGFECMKAWQKGEHEKAIAHNRSCLLKERDILMTRGFRKPDILELNK